MLKKTVLRLCALCLCAVGAACTGNTDDSEVLTETLTLNASAASITADGSDAVVFTVLDGSADVTSAATIRCLTDGSVLSGGRFTTETAGSYLFQAEYEGRTSAKKTVEAVEPLAASRFERKVCVMEFTGTWCAECPKGYTYLNWLIGYYEKYADDVCMMALHDNTQGNDPMGLAVTGEICTAFNLSGYPSFLTDLRDCGLLNDAREKIRESFDRSFDEYPAHCGVAVSSTCADGKASVAAKIWPETSGSYRVAVYVVENNIKSTERGSAYQQNDGGTYRDYTHNHVVRQLVSVSYKGDSLGTLNADAETVKEYEIDLSDEWDLANTFVYVLAIDGDGYVNNMNYCAIDGGDADYNYLTE